MYIGCVLAIFIFSGHILHICIFRVLNRFGQFVIQLTETVDVNDDLMLFLQLWHGCEQRKDTATTEASLT
jgi:hypothetical protein